MADSFVRSTGLFCFCFNGSSEILHILKVFSFFFNKLGVLLVMRYLAKLNLYRPSRHNAFSFREKLLSDDSFKEGAFAWVRNMYLWTGIRRLLSLEVACRS